VISALVGGSSSVAVRRRPASRRDRHAAGRSPCSSRGLAWNSTWCARPREATPARPAARVEQLPASHPNGTGRLGALIGWSERSQARGRLGCITQACARGSGCCLAGAGILGEEQDRISLVDHHELQCKSRGRPGNEDVRTWRLSDNAVSGAPRPHQPRVPGSARCRSRHPQ